jgi:hypothetical protein
VRGSSGGCQHGWRGCRGTHGPGEALTDDGRAGGGSEMTGGGEVLGGG